MKRIGIMILLLLASGSVAFGAQRAITPNEGRGISVAGGPTLSSFKSGGFLEVGFPLFVWPAHYLRDYILLNGYGTVTPGGGILSVMEKVAIGGRWPNGYDSYGFVAVGFGAFGSTGGLSFAAPYLVDVEGGGGIQFDMSRHLSYFLEIGGGWNVPTSNAAAYRGTPFNTGFALIRTGFRWFL